MIPEAPFLFSIAGISASLAGLAGLVAGLRRGANFRPIDLFRLREIVEFAFANVLLALSTIPLALILGSTPNALRVEALAALVYSFAHVVVLVRRSRQHELTTTRPWLAIALATDAGILAGVIGTLATGGVGFFEALLIVMISRPMFAFLLVLASFESEP